MSSLAKIAAVAAALALPSPRASGVEAPAPRVWLHGEDANRQTFDLRQIRGQVVAITFVSRYTRDEGARINRALLSHLRPGKAIVVSVIDFSSIPRFAHDYARVRIARHDRPGSMQYLIDTEGSMKQTFRVDPDRQVDILVIDREGALRGRYPGPRLDEALRLVDELQEASASSGPGGR